MVRPDPIPNSAVKHSLADGSSPIGSARVGCRQFFLKAETYSVFRLFLHFEAEMRILRSVKKATATAVARKFSQFFGQVEHGESVQIVKRGKIARQTELSRQP